MRKESKKLQEEKRRKDELKKHERVERDRAKHSCAERERGLVELERAHSEMKRNKPVRLREEQRKEREMWQ